MDDLETVLHNSDSQQLLAVVPPVHHQAVHQTLHDGALGLAESLGSVSEMENISKSVKIFHSIKCLPASGVGKKLGELLLDGDVVLEGHVRHLDVLAAPLPEQLDLGDLGEDGGGGLHLGHRLVRPIISHLDSGFILLKPNRRFT